MSFEKKSLIDTHKLWESVDVAKMLESIDFAKISKYMKLVQDGIKSDVDPEKVVADAMAETDVTLPEETVAKHVQYINLHRVSTTGNFADIASNFLKCAGIDEKDPVLDGFQEILGTVEKILQEFI